MLKRLYHRLVSSATRELREQNSELAQRLCKLESVLADLVERAVHIEDKESCLSDELSCLMSKENEISERLSCVENSGAELAVRTAHIEDREIELLERTSRIEKAEAELAVRTAHIEDREIELTERCVHIEDKENRAMSAAVSVLQKNASLNMYLPDDALVKYYDFGLFGMWFTQNYGAALTSFALGTRIKDLGYSIVQIDMPEIAGERCAWNMDNPGRAFIKKFFDTTIPFKIRHANALINICSAFVIGSDSLWGGNYRYQLESLEGVLYGSFNKSKPILAFSTSWGAFEVQEKFDAENRYMAFLFSRFSHISVRESASVETMRDVFNTEASWTLDPVFLVKKEVWESVLPESRADATPFVFAYILQPNEEKMRMVEETGRNLNLPVVFVSDMNKDHLVKFGDYRSNHSFEFKDDVRVEEWLSYMKNASLIVSDSYHGLCFSLIFEKQFVQLYPRDGMVRFQDLFKMLGYTPCYTLNDIASLLDRRIDYSSVTPKLREKIDRDNEELENCIRAAAQARRERVKTETDENLEEKIRSARVLNVLGGI